MSRSHKSTRPLITVALTVFTVLAILAPVAIAAPEVVHGVQLTSPTAASPTFVKATGTRIRVDYVIEIVRTQTDDVEVLASLSGTGGSATTTIKATDLKTGSNPFCFGPMDPDGPCIAPGLLVSPTASGWYDLEVCVRDIDPDGVWLCDKESRAVLVDYTPPSVELIKPENEAWVTGNEYLLVGRAWDAWDYKTSSYGITSVVFEYCEKGLWRDPEGTCDRWIKIATGTPTPGVPKQWDALWDTREVPDDVGYVRMCATNVVGGTACSRGNKISVVNHYSIDLRPGWNLISTPLIPYDISIGSVMLHLKESVKQVMTNDGACPPCSWTAWNPDPAVPDSLATFTHGKGYWIQMKAPATLTIEGYWTGLTPPSYTVVPDWNLIGYTHWGTPPMFPNKTVLDYLGRPLLATTQALWRYNPSTGTWVAMYGRDDMVNGFGYWLATSEGGRINP